MVGYGLATGHLERGAVWGEVNKYIQGGSKKSKLLYCDRYFNGWTIALTLNTLYSFVNGPGFERKLATLILFVWLNMPCFTLL